MQFAGKVVLVTGAQEGIGRAMAIEFAAAGADVAINWLDNQAAANEVLTLLNQEVLNRFSALNLR